MSNTFSFIGADGCRKLKYRYPTRNASSLTDSVLKRDTGRNESFLFMTTPAVLSWRLDPDDSLSDWTISVSSCPELEDGAPKYFDRFDGFDDRSGVDLQTEEKGKMNSTKIYFVHRAQLAVGPRKSEFFAKVFKRINSEARNELDSGSRTSNSNCTKIELVPSAASCFPVMLDYMYSGESAPLAISTDTAVGLRQLASSFGVRSMFRDTTEFIKRDLTVETAATYLLEAKKFKNKKLQQTAIEILARNFLTIKFTKIVSIPPDLMILITGSEKLKLDDEKKYSSRIASYCRCREDEVTLTLLETFTNGTMMSTSDEGEALYFLHLLYQLNGNNKSIRRIESMNLYQICLVQIPIVLKYILYSSNPQKMNEMSKSAFRKQTNDLELYNSLPSEIKVKLLECSFETSSSSPEMYSTTKVAPTLNDKKAKQEMFKLRDEVNQLKVSYDRKVQYYQRMLDAKVEELRKYAQQSDIPNEESSLSPTNITEGRQVYSYGM